MDNIISNNLKFSIIIPMYNVEDYIDKCIDSCMEQNINTNEYEVIIINDGSTDRSPDIIAFLAEKHKNLKLINQDRLGPGAARNRGLKEATGEYIWFIDGDDWIEKNCLKQLYEKIVENRLDLMWVKLRYLNSTNKRTSFYPGSRIPGKVLSGSDFLREIYSVYCYVVIFIINRKFLEKTGDKFKSEIYYEDSEFLPRMISKAERIKYEDIFCYNYFRRPNSIIQTFNEKRINDLIYVIKCQNEFLKTTDDESVKFYLKRLISHLVTILLRLSSHPSYKFKQELVLKELKLINLKRLSYAGYFVNFLSVIIFNCSPRLLLFFYNQGRRIN